MQSLSGHVHYTERLNMVFAEILGKVHGAHVLQAASTIGRPMTLLNETRTNTPTRAFTTSPQARKAVRGWQDQGTHWPERVQEFEWGCLCAHWTISNGASTFVAINLGSLYFQLSGVHAAHFYAFFQKLCTRTHELESANVNTSDTLCYFCFGVGGIKDACPIQQLCAGSVRHPDPAVLDFRWLDY
jgi:hypothetical protein